MERKQSGLQVITKSKDTCIGKEPFQIVRVQPCVGEFKFEISYPFISSQKM